MDTRTHLEEGGNQAHDDHEDLKQGHGDNNSNEGGGALCGSEKFTSLAGE